MEQHSRKVGCRKFFDLPLISPTNLAKVTEILNNSKKPSHRATHLYNKNFYRLKTNPSIAFESLLKWVGAEMMYASRNDFLKTATFGLSV